MQKGAPVADIHSPVLDAEQRARNYWFLDGLPNLVTGMVLLLMGFALLAGQMKPERPLLVGVSLVAVVLYLTFALRIRQVVEWLKARITYPRTGYTAPPYLTEDSALSPGRKRRAWVLIGFMVGVILVTRFVESRWICLAVGLLAGVSLWLAIRKSEKVSWIDLLTFPVVGSCLTVFPVAPRDRLPFFVLGAGLALALSGTLRLVQYLRRNPAPSA
jgi:hypothetical protein